MAPTLVVVCGWPLSGKTTVARLLKEKLGFHHVDIDEVRRLAIGLPHPHSNLSPELRAKDVEEMAGAYRFLLTIADWHLERGRSLIITATFSRSSGQRDLEAVYSKHPDAAVRIVWCRPTNDSEDEIRARLSRGFGEGYVGGVNSLERYLEVKDRYEPIALPHLLVDTSPPHSAEESFEQALRYVQAGA